jgi:hypothetical protein
MSAAAAYGRSLAWSALRRSAAPVRQDSATGPRVACLVAPFPRLVLAPETSRFICQILAWELISIVRQLMLIIASRCYLIQML